MSPMRLRQVALVAHDLEQAEDQLSKVLGVVDGYHDPGIIQFGLDNWVAPIGDTFLEVVSPVRDQTTAGRYLERRGGDGGYMAIFQTENLDAAVERIEGQGARIVWHGEAEHEGELTRGRHIHPRDCGGAIVSVDQAWPGDAWVWAGDGWRDRRAAGALRISAVEVQSTDPATMARRWSELLGESAVAAEFEGRPCWQILLSGLRDAPGGLVRFVEDRDGRGPGVSAIDFAVASWEPVLEKLQDAGLPCDAGRSGVTSQLLGVTVRFAVPDP